MLDLPERALPGAQPRRGPTATSARTSSASSVAAAPLAARPASARASATSSCWSRPRRSRPPTIERVPLWNDRRDEHGPFDIIGDVHGCCDELEELLGKLGYRGRPADGDRRATASYAIPRAARRSSSATWSIAARRSPDVLRLVMEHGRGRLGALRSRQPRHEAAAEAAGQGRPDHARPGRIAGRARRLPEHVRGVPRASSPSSSTAWSATTSSTTASSSSPTPG